MTPFRDITAILAALHQAAINARSLAQAYPHERDKHSKRAEEYEIKVAQYVRDYEEDANERT